jgi:hypothetical protein
MATSIRPSLLNPLASLELAATSELTVDTGQQFHASSWLFGAIVNLVA